LGINTRPDEQNQVTGDWNVRLQGQHQDVALGSPFHIRRGQGCETKPLLDALQDGFHSIEDLGSARLNGEPGDVGGYQPANPGFGGELKKRKTRQDFLEPEIGSIARQRIDQILTAQHGNVEAGRNRTGSGENGKIEFAIEHGLLQGFRQSRLDDEIGLGCADLCGLQEPGQETDAGGIDETAPVETPEGICRLTDADQLLFAGDDILRAPCHIAPQRRQARWPETSVEQRNVQLRFQHFHLHADG